MILSNVIIAQPQNRLFWDGGDWKHVSKLANYALDVEYRIKAAYINGLQDGRLFFYLKTWPGNEKFADSLYSEPMDYLSTNELVRSLDQFYKDPLNVYIPVPSAIIIANMVGEQVDKNIIDEYIATTRFWINSLMLDMQENGNSELLDQKLKSYKDRKLKN